MISSIVARASAAVLLAGGLLLLFAADGILPALIPGFPPAGAWLGQLLGGAWLALAALCWLQRGAVLGGIYGRPVVLANLVAHFVGAMVLARALARPDTPRLLWALAVPLGALAVAFGALLLRGPFDPLGTPAAGGPAPSPRTGEGAP